MKKTHILSKIIPVLLPILLVTVLVFLPIFIHPSLYLDRNNDLEEFFWPIYYFVRVQIINHHTLPLWNNLFLSGTPLLPDPQAPIFYIPNLIFLFLPLNIGFITIAFIHVFIGGVGVYFATKNAFKYSYKASVITAVFYISSPKLAGYLEAGHVGLINSWAWIPFAILAVMKLTERPNVKWSILLAVSMAGLFYTHTIIFLITAVCSVVLFSISLIIRRENFLKSLWFFFLGGLLAFGLTAISFLPQLVWKDLTTRNLLLIKRQIYPIWTSKIEFLSMIFTPWSQTGGVQVIDTEKWIPLGIILSLLSFLGFLKTAGKIKVLVLFATLVFFLVALGNSSPIYEFLIRQDWFATMRIPTRAFFPIIIFAIFLAGYSFDKYKLPTWLSILVVVESLFLSWNFLQKPIHQRHDVPEEIYKILESDKDRFRVLCLTNCISQKEASKRGLELVEGYSTLTQQNYYSHSLQLIGGYWDYYSIPTPPNGVYLFQDLKPNTRSLALYNTKYLIYNKEILDQNLKLVGKYNDFYLYEILNFQPRANVPIISYSPNKIVFDTTNFEGQSVVVSEVYSPGWKAYLDGREESPVQQTPEALRAVNIKPDTKYVVLEYRPQAFEIGKNITIFTYLIIFAYLLKDQDILKYGIKSKKKNKK